MVDELVGGGLRTFSESFFDGVEFAGDMLVLDRFERGPPDCKLMLEGRRVNYD